MPLLRVLAGPSPDTLVPITHLVNSGTPHAVQSELFEGQVAVFVKGFMDAASRVVDTEYFGREDRQGITWSIQVQGRFLQPYSTDDILFGNTFDRPLKLPWGSGAALKFMTYIDPTLEHDLSSPTQPWALSPLISTMPNLTHSRINSPHQRLLQFPPPYSIGDNTSQLHYAQVDALDDRDSESSGTSSLSSTGSGMLKTKDDVQRVKKKKKGIDRGTGLGLRTSTARRSYFASAKHRNEFVFGPNDLVTTDFCYGFLEFNPTISLRLPGGVSFDLTKHWDGQAVRFVCCERKKVGDEAEGTPWGRIFWCVTIELAGEEDIGVLADDVD